MPMVLHVIEQVPVNSSGQYFTIEEYFLHEAQRSSIKQKHANVILDISPKPQNLVKAIKARHIDVILDCMVFHQR